MLAGMHPGNPSIGQVVLYTLRLLPDGKPEFTNNGGIEAPAVVVRTFGGTAANMCILADNDAEPTHRRTSVSYNAGGKPGTWRWRHDARAEVPPLELEAPADAP